MNRRVSDAAEVGPTADMLEAVQVIIDKTIEMNGQAFVVFIDYRKAFDSISQVHMFEILSEMGYPKHLVALLEALYNDQSVRNTRYRDEWRRLIRCAARAADHHSL